MTLRIHPHDLPLADPFRIAHESRTVQPTLIVELRDEASELSGLGEAPMTRYYGLETAACTALLEDFAPAFAPWNLEELKLLGIEGLLRDLPGDLNPFLRCAIDVALHDLWAKDRGKRLGTLWKQNRRRMTPTCYTIGLAPLPEMVRKLKAMPWPVYKIKLGGGDDDVNIIRELRKHTKAPFYVDANTGWTGRQTIDHAIHLKELGVQFIEQPLKPEDVEEQRMLNRHCVLPIFADESCQTEADVEACAELYSGINIKVVKCGGLLPARRMIAPRARPRAGRDGRLYDRE